LNNDLKIISLLNIKMSKFQQQRKIQTLYNPIVITKLVTINIINIGNNIKEVLEKVIASQIEGKCIVEGYIQPRSTQILTFSSGLISGSEIAFNVVFQCNVCYPVEGMLINCVAKHINKAGIRAETKELPSPVVIFVARDHNYTSPVFAQVKENDDIKVRVIGQRFELNDTYISIIAELVENYTEGKKVQKPKTMKMAVPEELAVPSELAVPAQAALEEPVAELAPAAIEEPVAEPAPAEPAAVEEPLVSDLYDGATVFRFYSKSADKPLPGKGEGEKLGPEGSAAYTELARMPQWRKKLSNAWPAEFKLDGHKWLSVEHYYQGSKFKKNNKAFYLQFSLDTPDSAMAKDPAMAEAAGSKTGKFKTEQLRPKNITADADFSPEQAMEAAMRAKFTQNAELKTLLLATKKAKLQHISKGVPDVVFNDLMRVRRELQPS
jgi:predicted NAD-dependent protein-ADP-ribosyltransferase YbiA (DUF1768 family)/DNA-directed RNA polymerase subunit E'/Rpb7